MTNPLQAELDAWAKSDSIDVKPYRRGGKHVGTTYVVRYPTELSLPLPARTGGGDGGSDGGGVAGTVGGLVGGLDVPGGRMRGVAGGRPRERELALVRSGPGSFTSELPKVLDGTLSETLAVPVGVSLVSTVREGQDPSSKEVPWDTDLLWWEESPVPGAPVISVVPVPRVVERTGDEPKPRVEQLWLHVSITLSTAPVSLPGDDLKGATVHRSFPPFPVPRLVVPIPRTALLHIHRSFAASGAGVNMTDTDPVPGAGLLAIHPNSGLSSAAGVVEALRAAQDAVRDITDVGGVARMLLGLEAAQEAIGGQGQHIRSEVLDVVGDLDDFLLIQNDTFENDIEAEDEVSAILLTGGPGQKAHFFVDTDCDTDEGAFRLKVGKHGFTIVNSLSGNTPVTDPKGMYKAIAAPEDDTWNDALSSFRFM